MRILAPLLHKMKGWTFYHLGVFVYWDKKADVLEFNFCDRWVKYYWMG